MKFAELRSEEAEEIAQAIKGLLEIAKLAMPESFFTTDSRVKRACKLLPKIEAQI